MSEKKYACKDCEYYKPIDETKGDCPGHVIPTDMPAEKCPAKAFEPRGEDEKKNNPSIFLVE